MTFRKLFPHGFHLAMKKAGMQIAKMSHVLTEFPCLKQSLVQLP